MKDEIWCAIPVYNNAATIVDVARRAREVAHVLVVDDGSTDADLREVLGSVDVTVIRHERNRGKGAALRTAFEYAAAHGGEYVITLDGDGQHYPEDIPRFLPPLGAEVIVIGARKEVVGEMPERSRFGRAFSDFWITTEAGGNAKDTQSGYRGYPLAMMGKLKTTADRYHFEMEIITRALWAGLRVESVGVRVWYPPVGERVSHFHPVRDNWRISLLHARLVLRELLPIPHRRLVGRCEESWVQRAAGALTRNAGAMGLMLAMVAGFFPSVVLYPWGGLVSVYLGVRLHMNMLGMVLLVAVCSTPLTPAFANAIGALFVDGEVHPRAAWVIGAHGLAGILAAMGIVGVWVFDRRVAR